MRFIVWIIILILILALGFAIVDLFVTYNANRFLKHRIDTVSRELREYQAIYTEDKNIYWKGSSAFINQTNKPLKKVLNINSLIEIREQGYR